MRKGLTLNALAKQIAAPMKLKAADVRAVLESKKTGLPRTTVTRITETARTLIHAEILRLDAHHHPRGPESAPRRRAPAAPRRSR